MITVYFSIAGGLKKFTVSICEEFDRETSNLSNCDECFEQVEALSDGETRDWYCDKIIPGKYTVIRLNENGILTLCEVKIFSIKGIEGIKRHCLLCRNFILMLFSQINLNVNCSGL